MGILNVYRRTNKWSRSFHDVYSKFYQGWSILSHLHFIFCSYGNKTFLTLPSPRYLGPAQSDQAVYIGSSHDRTAEILVFKGKCLLTLYLRIRVHSERFQNELFGVFFHSGRRLKSFCLSFPSKVVTGLLLCRIVISVTESSNNLGIDCDCQ